MVRALLAGTKTQTRRIVKNPERLEGLMGYKEEGAWCPYGQPGDRLKVGEAWRTLKEYDDLSPAQLLDHAPISYEADGVTLNGHWGRYRNARFLPMRFRRLELEIVDVRVERLKDISREDAIAEGLVQKPAGTISVEMGCNWGFEGDTRIGSPISAYAALWQSINGPDSWQANPWVWVVSFEVVQP
jgi:hypothetical protein